MKIQVVTKNRPSEYRLRLGDFYQDLTDQELKDLRDAVSLHEHQTSMVGKPEGEFRPYKPFTLYWLGFLSAILFLSAIIALAPLLSSDLMAWKNQTFGPWFSSFQLVFNIVLTGGIIAIVLKHRIKR